MKRRRGRQRKPHPRTKLLAARETAQLSQRQLASLSNCTEGTINDIESGRNRQPAYDKVVRIVRALQRHGLPNVTADELFAVAPVRRYPA